MATEKNRRDMEQRKIHYDQVSFLFPKGGRRLLRAMGIKERCTAADIIRRAVLARAGLEKLPDKNMLDKLDKAETPREAADALIDCQIVEYVKGELLPQWRPTEIDDTTVVMVSSKWYKDESMAALQTLQKGVQEQNTMKKPRPIELTRREHDILCRLLANTVIIDENNI